MIAGAPSPDYSWYEDKSPQTVGSVLTTETQRRGQSL